MTNSQALILQLKSYAQTLGFQQIAITDTDLSSYEPHLLAWLQAGWQGEMSYMAKHGVKRTHPQALMPNTLRVISARMDYLPQAKPAWPLLQQPKQAYISRYALGRDYHKLMRKRLTQLATHLQHLVGPHGYRSFCDSAPILEKTTG